MTVRPYQLLLALLEQHKPTDILADANSIPGVDALARDTTIFYVDAGSRGERAQADFYYLKLAVLARSNYRSQVEERVYHPLVKVGGDTVPPLLVGRGGERARQAASYVVELAALLALSRQGPSLLASEGLGAPGRLILVRHGPLFQMVHHYTSKPYIVDVDDAVRLLEYAGLEPPLRRDLIDESYACSEDGRNVDRNKVVLGLLAITTLERLIEGALKDEYAVAGLVEDVSQSRLLVSATTARLVKSVLGRVSGTKSPVGLTAHLADEMRNTALKGFHNQGARITECLSLDPGQLHQEADSRVEWSQLATALSQGMLERFNKNLEDAEVDELETIILWGRLAPDITDSELLYTIYYIAGGGDLYPAAKPLPHRPRLLLARYYLTGPQGRAKCYSEEDVENRLRKLERIVYQYAAPVRPPTCGEIMAMLSSQGLQGVSPYDVAQLVSTPPAIRVEYVEGMPAVDELLALAIYPSRIVLYGYPPQLLVVDRFSRISPSETLAFRGIIEELAERVQPYTSFVRGWETRITHVT